MIRNQVKSNKQGVTPAPDETNGYLSAHAGKLISSYRYWTGGALVDPDLSVLEQARVLFVAPFIVASHGTESDPVFNYANRAALALFDTDWKSFISMPSRLSAEPDEREERLRLLSTVTARGFMNDYHGVRVSTLGRRFRIKRATVWTVIDANRLPAGQAVMFTDWEYL